jgi:phospholipid-translocating ATPase
MLTAVEDYFPESDILQEDGIKTVPSTGDSSTDGSRPNLIQRVNTGISSIVGANNGDRPGGFVLVIDGTALEQVCPLL